MYYVVSGHLPSLISTIIEALVTENLKKTRLRGRQLKTQNLITYLLQEEVV